MADTLQKTAQIATNFSQDLIANLPTSRDLNSILLMAPGVHPTGPAGAFSFGGSVTFENLFLLNGVSINENIRGQAFDTAIEDAIQETTVANGGVSAEFGRFSGGVVNIITKSGGNQFSGSLRESLNNDKWRTLTPFETSHPRDHARAARRRSRADDRVHAGRSDHARSTLVLHVGTPPRRGPGPVRSLAPTFRMCSPKSSDGTRSRAPIRRPRSTASRPTTTATIARRSTTASTRT